MLERRSSLPPWHTVGYHIVETKIGLGNSVTLKISYHITRKSRYFVNSPCTPDPITLKISDLHFYYLLKIDLDCVNIHIVYWYTLGIPPLSCTFIRSFALLSIGPSFGSHHAPPPTPLDFSSAPNQRLLLTSGVHPRVHCNRRYSNDTYGR